MYKQAGFYVHKTLVDDTVYNLFYTDLSKPWIILLPGLPQYVHKQWYLKDLIETHCVLNPYYPGSFHSFGEFNSRNLSTVIEKCLELVYSKKFFDHFDKKEYGHTGVLDGVWGLSFGANLIFEYLARNEAAGFYSLLVSPLTQMSNPLQKAYWEQKLGFLESKVYSNVFRGLNAPELLAWLQRTESLEISGKPHGGLIYGADDKYMDKGFLESKFKGFEIRGVAEHTHEVDKLIELYIQNSCDITNL